MKTCPFCQVENGDNAQTCRFCGRDLNPPLVAWDSAPPEDSPEPTQPVYPGGKRPAKRPAQSAQDGLSTPPPGGWNEPDAGQTQPPYRPAVYDAGSAATQSYDAPPPGPGTPGYQPSGSGYGYAQNPRRPQSGYQTQGYAPQAGRTAGTNTPGYGGAGGYPPYPPPGARVYPQPGPANRRSDRLWMVLVGVLVVLLLCVGGLTAWVFSATAAGGFGRAGADLATQAADLFAGAPAASRTPFPTGTLAVPSPWPTFTTQPSQTPEPTSTPAAEVSPLPEATQTGGLERYLTEECASALDRLEGLSKAVTENPALPLDATWRDELGQSVRTVRAECGSLDQASPVPELMSEAQQNLDSATQAFDEANRLFKEGVEELNPGKVLEAGKQVAEATKYLNQALGALRRIGE